MQIFAMLILAVFIAAIQVSYKIERLARNGKQKDFPTYTNFLSAAFGSAGKFSADTLKLRSILRALLLLIVLLMGAMAITAIFFLPQGYNEVPVSPIGLESVSGQSNKFVGR